MRRCFLRPGYWCVLVAFVLPVNILLAGNPVAKSKSVAAKAAFAEQVSSLYTQIDLKETGLTKKAFECGICATEL